jgi:hypothetical protein
MDRVRQPILKNNMGHPNVKTKPSNGNVLDHSSASSGAAPSGAHIVMLANESRTYFVFQNISDTVMSINFGANAGAADSIVVQPGGSVTFNSAWVPSQEVRLRCSSASKSYVAKQGI